MWTEREREDLAVWADALQAAGDPLGELVTTSLLLDARADGPERRELAARKLELELATTQPLIDELFAGFPEFDATWEHGLVVGLRVVDHSLGRRLGQRALDSLRRLLRLPVARFLRTLRVDVRELGGSPIHREVPALLAEPEIVARPWTVTLGAPPRHLRRRAPIRALDLRGREDAFVEPERELRSLFLDTVRIELPWHRGDKGTRLRAAQTLIAGRLDDPAAFTRLARALTDPSMRVRLTVLDALPLLGAQAAPLVPELLLVDRDEFEWVTRVREVLDTLSRNPELVEAVARNFSADQSRCAHWLAASPLQVARRAAPRITAMLDGPGGVEHWARRELDQARRRMDYRESLQREGASLDSRSPTGQPLFRRLRRAT